MSLKRSRLQEHTLEMLTFLQCNLRLVPVPKPVAESVAISLRKKDNNGRVTARSD